MDVIEFFKRTDHRNLICSVNLLVKQRMRAIKLDLEIKRQRLRSLFECEHLIYSEELLHLVVERLREKKRKREQWNETLKKEREIARQQLLQLKAAQRELENCEEIRHLKSKQILLETKATQRHQIAEKQLRLEREKELDRLWVDVMLKFEEEKKNYEAYGQKLRNILAKMDQTLNATNEEKSKTEAKTAKMALQQEMTEKNERAIKIQKNEDEKLVEHKKDKKFKQNEMLQQQIKENLEISKKLQETEATIYATAREREQKRLENERTTMINSKVHNLDWHNNYLAYAVDEKSAKKQHERKFDDIFVGTGCVLQQKPKRPYGKMTR